jgi:hypothetical protein
MAHGAVEWDVKSPMARVSYPWTFASNGDPVGATDACFAGPLGNASSLSERIYLSVSWESKDSKGGPSPFELNAQAVRTLAMRDVMATYIGTISALNWADRRKVLDFFAAQQKLPLKGGLSERWRKAYMEQGTLFLMFQVVL